MNFIRRVFLFFFLNRKLDGKEEEAYSKAELNSPCKRKIDVHWKQLPRLFCSIMLSCNVVNVDLFDDFFSNNDKRASIFLPHRCDQVNIQSFLLSFKTRTPNMCRHPQTTNSISCSCKIFHWNSPHIVSTTRSLIFPLKTIFPLWNSNLTACYQSFKSTWHWTIIFN